MSTGWIEGCVGQGCWFMGSSGGPAYRIDLVISVPSWLVLI